MSESGDFTPASWAPAPSFSSARAAYDSHAGRSYSDAVAKGKSRHAVLESKLDTDSASPLVIVSDVTGSMGDATAIMFEKLPYLSNECKEYLGKEAQICFAAVGDANGDTYPLQVRKFTKESGLVKTLKELVIEGGGGGTKQESYELAATYFAHNVDMPKAIHPVLIFIGDESTYDTVSKAQAKDVAGVTLEKDVSTRNMFDSLQRKFSVYFIQRPYSQQGGETMSGDTRQIRTNWEKYIPSDRIVYLPDPRRVVDVIFGLLANETGKKDYFEGELKSRQNANQIKEVLTSLRGTRMMRSETVPKLTGASITRKK